jgi:LEA14-like dessication related protein
MILIVVPVYVYIDSSTRPPSIQERTVVGDLQVQSTTVDMTGLDQSGLSLNLRAVVYNPNGFGATLDAANYSIYADGICLGAGQTVQEYDLAPRSSQTLVFPLSIGWKSAFETTGSYIVSLGGVTWKVNGTAEVEVGGFPLLVPFSLATG